jgi:hypothetical protein
MSTFIRRLQKVHARLDLEISGELKRRWPDLARVMRLKKIKLAIKDQLHSTQPRSSLRAG